MKDLSRRHIGQWSEGGARGRHCKPLPGSFGHQPPSTTETGARGARWTGTGRGRVTPAPPRPRKHGLELGLREESSLGSEPRWNADRCAHPEGCAAVPGGTARGQLASVGVPLPSISAWRSERSGQETAGTTPYFSVGHLLFALQSWRQLRNSGARERERSSAPAIAGEGDHAKHGGGGV